MARCKIWEQVFVKSLRESFGVEKFSSFSVKMRDFPSCFGENGVQVADSSSSNTSKNAQNLVDIKPWLFSKRKGSKSLEAYLVKLMYIGTFHQLIFGSGPEPSEGFYVAVVVDRQMALFLGDMRKEAFKKTGATPIPSNSVFVAKREHVFGKKAFRTKAQFCDNGQIHDLVIECDTIGVSDPCLLLRVDCKTVMQVKQLRWKFRGNHTILVDGLAIELFWMYITGSLVHQLEMLFLCSRLAPPLRSCGLANRFQIQMCCHGPPRDFWIPDHKNLGWWQKWSIGYGARTPQCIYVTKEYMSNCDLQVTTAYKLRVVTVFTNITKNESPIPIAPGLELHFCRDFRLHLVKRLAESLSKTRYLFKTF
ncbi:hypothetical protein NC652_030411 [Populus alba x Populus x berolinensis]|nr:hypothetical protein NC652_030411 [Populus alba x Populus x berolinensis]